MASVKRFKWLFIPFLAILLMSHNAGAVSTTYSLDNYSIINDISSLKMDCQIMDTSNNVISTFSDAWVCSGGAFNKTYKMHYISSHETFTFEKDDIFEFDILVWSPNSLIDGFVPMNLYSFSTSMALLEISQPINNVFYNNNFSIVNGTGGTENDGSVYATSYHFVYKVKSNTGLKIGYPFNSDNFMWSGSTLTFRMLNYHHYRLSEDATPEQQNEINATQDAADSASSSGSSSAADAETATSSLISVIGGFVNVLTSAQPTNCKINANLNHIDMGELDLCSNPVPSYIQIIGSIILICAAIPLAIVLFNRFIGLFRSFQG